MLKLSRRTLLKNVCAAAALLNLSPGVLLAADRARIMKKIPKTGEALAVMGLGTSGTFDVDAGDLGETELYALMQAFFANGGQLIDSSPMYGNAETVIGKLLKQTRNKGGLFAATKVWTDGKEAGIAQMNASMNKMGVSVMDLMQIHNLRDWRTHLQTLRDWKDQGKIRYIGITTSHGRAHAELEAVMQSEPLDFVQFSYNIEDRAAERRLLPIALDRGIAVLINRPFQRGGLFGAVRGKALPGWAAEFDCASWGQFFLKFAASHPAATCVIPATAKLKHMLDNMAAGHGRLPDETMRRRMIQYMESL